MWMEMCQKNVDPHKSKGKSPGDSSGEAKEHRQTIDAPGLGMHHLGEFQANYEMLIGNAGSLWIAGNRKRA